MSKCSASLCEFAPADGLGLCYFHSRGMKPPLAGGAASPLSADQIKAHQSRLREEAARHAGLRGKR